MSRLIQIDPEAKLNPEPEGYEFGYHAFEDMEPIKSDIQEIRVSTDKEPITLPQEEIKLPLNDEKLLALQAKDKFCNDISNKLKQGQLQEGSDSDPAELYEILAEINGSEGEIEAGLEPEIEPPI